MGINVCSIAQHAVLLKILSWLPMIWLESNDLWLHDIPLPKTNSLPWKLVLGRRSFSFGARLIFRGQVLGSRRVHVVTCSNAWRSVPSDCFGWFDTYYFGPVVVQTVPQCMTFMTILWPYINHIDFSSLSLQTQKSLTQLFLSLDDIYLAFSQNQCLCIGKNIIPTAQLRVKKFPKDSGDLGGFNGMSRHQRRGERLPYERQKQKHEGGSKYHDTRCIIYIYYIIYIIYLRITSCWMFGLFVFVVLLDLHVMWKDVRVSLESSQVEWSVNDLYSRAVNEARFY